MNRYIVIKRNKLLDLSIDVTAMLNDGWKLQGGVAVCEETIMNFKNLMFLQALIKE